MGLLIGLSFTICIVRYKLGMCARVETPQKWQKKKKLCVCLYNSLHLKYLIFESQSNPSMNSAINRSQLCHMLASRYHLLIC